MKIFKLLLIFALLVISPTAIKAGVFDFFKSEKSYEESGFKPLSKESLENDLKNKNRIFIDFTAAWCPTCQVADKVIKDPDVLKAFEEKGYKLYVADMTRSNDYYSQLLKTFKTGGLPTYILYNSEGHYKEFDLTSSPPYLDKQNIINMIKDGK